MENNKYTSAEYVCSSAYRNKGYNFTITSSTAYDHKWIPGKNVFDTIDRVVDSIFANYLSRPNVKQPILTQYCDGKKVSCPNWMTLLLHSTNFSIGSLFAFPVFTGYIYVVAMLQCYCSKDKK